MTQGTTQMYEKNSDADSTFSFLDLLIIVARYKRRFILIPLVVAIIAGSIGFLLPNSYKASTQLLPPQQATSGTAALLSQLNGVAGAVAGNMSVKGANDVYIGMLKSRTVADRIIENFDLKKKYDTTSLERARLKLELRTTITAGKDGLITIEVEDSDQKVVAKLANAYVTELLRLNGAFALTESSQRRVFYERQLEDAKDRLARAEIELKVALGKSGVVSVDSDSRAVVEIAGRLRAQISAKEIQLQSMEAFVTESNNDYQRLKQELISLRAELGRFENGPQGSTAAISPELSRGGLQNIKLLRDLKYREMLYELLAKQYELARLDEAKNPSIIQVLDPALEPEREFKPRRMFIVLGATLAGLVIAILSVFFREVQRISMERSGGAAKWAELKFELLSKRARPTH